MDMKKTVNNGFRHLDNAESFLSYLAYIAAIQRGRVEKDHCRSARHSAEGYVLAHGYFMTGKLDPPDTHSFNAKKQCFRNAGMMALMDSNLIYCEGFATSIIPLHHAWCLDRKTGKVVDPTWDSDNMPEDFTCLYVGLPFKTDFLRQETNRNGVWGVMYPRGLNEKILKGDLHKLDALVQSEDLPPVAEKLSDIDLSGLVNQDIVNSLVTA